jgi:hypothetical protein
MQHLDRDTARALTDAGYMPLCEYIQRFGNQPGLEPGPDVAPERVTVGTHRARQWSVPAHFASPTRPDKYRLRHKRERSAS